MDEGLPIHNNEYYGNVWRKKLMSDEATSLEVRLGMQVLVLNKMNMDIGDKKATTAFSDMYDSDFEFEKKGVRTYVSELVKEKKLDEAIDFMARAMNRYIGKLESQKKAA